MPKGTHTSCWATIPTLHLLAEQYTVARATQHPRSGEVLTAISDGLVALLKDYYGKGPTETKTYYEDDLVVCLFRGIGMPVEHTLEAGGFGDVVLHQRMVFQELMHDRFKEVVERATRRRVIGVMSGHQPHPEMCCEVFVLAPRSGVSQDALS